MLKYKLLRKEKHIITIDEYCSSSQISIRCNSQDEKYKNLEYRGYIYIECKLKLNQNLNASINIMYESIKKYIKIII